MSRLTVSASLLLLDVPQLTTPLNKPSIASGCCLLVVLRPHATSNTTTCLTARTDHTQHTSLLGSRLCATRNLDSCLRNKCVCRLAGLFVKPLFYEPLVALQDPLPGLHANTHLAQASCLHTAPTMGDTPLLLARCCTVCRDLHPQLLSSSPLLRRQWRHLHHVGGQLVRGRCTCRHAQDACA